MRRPSDDDVQPETVLVLAVVALMVLLMSVAVREDSAAPATGQASPARAFPAP